MGQTSFPVEFPVGKTQKPVLVEVAGRAGCKQNTVQHRFRIHCPFVPPKDLSRAMATIFALLVCPVSLMVVVKHPLAMDLQCLLPTGCDSEFGIGHSAKDIEMRRDIVLPGLSLFNLLFCDTKRFIDC